MTRGKSGLGKKGGSTPKPSPQQRKHGPVGRVHIVSQTVAAEPAVMEEDHFQALMQAMPGCQTTMTAKIDTLQTDFGLIQRDINKR